MEKYTPLQQKAYEYLKEQIFSGRFEKGRFYSESKIAAETGFSRTPIKDALTRLCHDKYIDIIPSKGFRLHVITADDIRNSYQLRTAIEGYSAANIASEMGTEKAEKTVEALKASIEHMAEIIDKEDRLSDFLKDDMDFHRIMVEYLNNEEILDLSASYDHRQHDYALKTYMLPERKQSAYEEHLKIYDAIKKGSMMEAFGALKYHLDKTCEISLLLMEKSGNKQIF